MNNSKIHPTAIIADCVIDGNVTIEAMAQTAAILVVKTLGKEAEAVICAMIVD